MKNSSRVFSLILGSLAVVSVGLYLLNESGFFSIRSTNDVSYQTERISVGNISKTVSATGTLSAVNDVVVGAQLSGQIETIYADFNDEVDEGQLLAQIEPSYFAARVAQANALVEKSAADIVAQELVIARAKLNHDKALRDLKRAQGLYANNSISDDAMDSYQTAAQQTEIDWQHNRAQLQILAATLAANKASLDQAQIDLDRTEIRAPIAGFVINRTIEAGQTVASSYNTPELFTLAKSLSEMEIEAYIDESDIGQIRTEQNVRFTVDAFPDRQFNGRVNQIRKAPQSNAGVISYIVIIDTRNPDSSLLPGMTANLDISIDTLRDAQRVSNAALRAATRFGVTTDGETRGMAALEQLDLSAEQREIIRERLPRREAGAPASRNRQQRQQLQALLREVLTEEQLQLQENIRNGQVKLGQLLIMDDEGVQPVQVQFGISDDKFTAVLSPDLGDAEVVTQFKVNN